MVSKDIVRLVKLSLVLIIFMVTNLGVWLCLFDLTDSVSFCTYRSPRTEFILYFFAVSLAVLLLTQMEHLSLFMNKWKRNWAILLFVLFAFISLLWSVNLRVSAYQFVLFFLVTFFASVLGLDDSDTQWLERFFWFFATVVLFSFVLLIFFPNAAIMAEPHLGSWRGVFWHKNFTGSLMAFGNIIFLLYGITSTGAQIKRVFSGFLYLISLVYVFFSLSAAGVATYFALNIIFVLIWLWNRVKHFLTRKHYWYLVVGILLIGSIASFNYESIFKLLGRSSTLTGRTPLWGYLYQAAVTESPLVGHGFSAIWSQDSFREQVTLSQHWGFTITNGHNGFMDILLNLGWVGVCFVFFLFILAFYRSWNFFVARDHIVSALPLLIVLYVFLANLSISFLLEFEFFHWFLLILVLFLTTSNVENKR